jgi:hypothetical protein
MMKGKQEKTFFFAHLKWDKLGTVGHHIQFSSNTFVQLQYLQYTPFKLLCCCENSRKFP